MKSVVHTDPLQTDDSCYTQSTHGLVLISQTSSMALATWLMSILKEADEQKFYCCNVQSIIQFPETWTWDNSTYKSYHHWK